MTNADLEAELNNLLNLLTATKKDQVASFPDFVDVADEISLRLSEFVLLIDSEVPEEVGPVISGLKEIDSRLDELSSDPKRWRAEASDLDFPIWQEIRRSAREWAHTAGIELGRPINLPRYIQ